jgi:hypothetical protein
MNLGKYKKFLNKFICFNFYVADFISFIETCLCCISIACGLKD